MSSSRLPRVRYAPSPTGFPHIGNIHTALFNWLFARHAGGTFILRIEDTDQDRIVPGSLEAIYESLRWLGMQWDEGPEVGGPLGPYFQSERLAIYQAHAEELLQKGFAYRCFCSQERLAAVRAAQEARKEPPRYDQLCRIVDPAISARRARDGEPHVVRMAVPNSGQTSFHDILRGEISFQNVLIDDQVLMKSDGWPTYHLANVVDDHLMGVTHVLRGDEWISSTPKHVLLYRFFGWELPIFGHFPILLTTTRAKLSKRRGAPDTLDLRANGYLPDAVVNFLSLLGWSPEGKEEVLSRAELISQFTLERVGATPSIYSPEKLDWLNGHYIRQLSPDELTDRLIPYFQEAGLIPAQAVLPNGSERIARIVPLIQERIRTLKEAAELSDFFFKEQIVYDPALLIAKGWSLEQTLAALRRSRETLAAARAAGAFDIAHLEHTFRDLASAMGVKTGQLFGSLRVAVTGRTVAPPLFHTMEVLGPDLVLRRVDAAIDLLGAGVHAAP